MSPHSINARTSLLLLALAAGGVDALSAQELGQSQPGQFPDERFATSEIGPPSMGPARTIPCTSFDDDSHYPLGYEETLDLAIQAVFLGRADPEKDTRKCFFRMAEALTQHLVLEDPKDPEPRYWYSASMALRANEEGGRTQVGLAQRAHEQARLTLNVAPDHAGAQHVLGRLHAAVMRLSGFKRFIATRILGGKALSEASWKTAETFLAAAASLQPGVPIYHYELGALYLDTDRPELAIAAFERVLACPLIHPADREVYARARQMIEQSRREMAGEAPHRATLRRPGRRRAGSRR